LVALFGYFSDVPNALLVHSNPSCRFRSFFILFFQNTRNTTNEKQLNTLCVPVHCVFFLVLSLQVLQSTQILFYTALSVLSVSCSQDNNGHQFSTAKIKLEIVWSCKEWGQVMHVGNTCKTQRSVEVKAVSCFEHLVIALMGRGKTKADSVGKERCSSG